MAAAPFVVGRPNPDAPFSAYSGLRRPDLGMRRARTTLSTEITPSYEAMTKARETVTSVGIWPRIVVRDVTGRTLDTFTTLQDAIYRASWTLKTLHEWPVTPLEWRLPKAPVPSRPDFSRVGMEPRAATSYCLHIGTSYRTEAPECACQTSHDVTHQRLGGARWPCCQHGQRTPPRLNGHVDANSVAKEIDVDDVSFVAESIRMLPQLPSFAFLRHSLLAGQRTYLRIVGSIVLHQRQLAATEKRETDYSFPGFCAGCRRSGLCYGCDKNPRPHVHEDIPMRTGGGFVYWRKDRPVNERLHRHPCNWPVTDTDSQLRNIIARYGGLAEYERAALAAHYLMNKGDVTSEVTTLRHLHSRVRLLTGPWPDQTNLFTPLMPDSRAGEVGDEGEGVESDVSEAEEETRVSTATERRSRKTSRYSREATEKTSRFSREKTEGRQEDAGKKVSTTTSLRRSVTIDTGVTRIHDDEDSNVEEEEEEVEEEEEEEGEEAGQKEVVEKKAVRRSRAAERFQGESGEPDVTETDNDSGFEGGSERARTRKVGIVEAPSPPRPKRPSTLSPSRSVTFTQGSGSRSGSLRSRSKSPAVGFGSSISSRENTGKSRSSESAETSESRKAKLENIPFAGKRRDVLYKPPPAFKPLKKNRRITVAKDPFSTDRQYDLPKGGAFTIKKGDRKVTQFVNIKRGDDGWKAPKKFELKQTDRKTTEFWSPKVKSGDKGKGRRGQGDDDDSHRRRGRKLLESEDSGLDSDLRSASTRGKGDGDGEKDQTETDGADKDAVDTTDNVETELKKRREVVKKQRRPISPPGAKIRPKTPSPPPPPREPTPEPTPPPTPPPETPPVEEPPLPDISLPEIPDLPEWKQPTKADRQKKLKFMVAAPTPMKEGPKKRRPPPKARRPIKVPMSRPKTRPAEAPVSAEQVQDMQDPLDWLAKYCIINPDRLPFYEIIFETVVQDQSPRYTKPSSKKEGEEDETAKEADEEEEELKGKKRKGKKKKKESSKSTGDNKDKPDQLSLLHKGLFLPKTGLSLPEQQLEKLCYTLGTIQHRLEELSADLQRLDEKRTKQLAEKGRELFPEISAPDYKPKTKKKGKKSKGKDTSPPRRLTEADITDEVIVSRLDDKMLATLRHDPDVRQTELEMQRAREKTNDQQERLEQLASEKLLTDAFCVNHYFMRQGVNQRPQDFKRQQSELYNRLHPDPDFEMNMEELPEALQAVNNHLLTEKEVFFLYNVLNLPARSTLNFRLFTIVAALSEKVTQLDPVVRKLINNCDYNALDIKMEKCRELFQLIEDDEHMPKGGASADRLAVELTAGGLTPEHTKFVLKKFNREGKGIVDFLDFVTYVPLFVLIHKRIITDPLREELDL